MPQWHLLEGCKERVKTWCQQGGIQNPLCASLCKPADLVLCSACSSLRIVFLAVAQVRGHLCLKWHESEMKGKSEMRWLPLNLKAFSEPVSCFRISHCLFFLLSSCSSRLQLLERSPSMAALGSSSAKMLAQRCSCNLQSSKVDALGLPAPSGRARSGTCAWQHWEQHRSSFAC